jgi:hypothetical protein
LFESWFRLPTPMTFTIPHTGRRGYSRPKLLLAVLPNQLIFVID